MGNGYRPACFDLLFEQWDHRTIASQDISKTDGYKFGLCNL